jgi:TonB-linked SusC/RagA family outer membrane protein
MKKKPGRFNTIKRDTFLFSRIFLVSVFLIMQLCAFSQEKAITGTVTGTDGIPIPGVAVVVKGTTIGTNTDSNGKFSLSVPPSAQVLQFSFLGKETKEVPLGAANVYDVILSESTVGLDEVVVIGYGTQKKSDLTGSVVRVDMEQKTQLANVTVTAALQGVTAGVNVGATTSAGEAPDISIRGRTSLSATDAPLIVLDGIIYNGSITDININDVESIDILKDASATAVFGARSANGVMIITTKKGKSEKPVFNVNAYYGYQDFTNNPVKIMNGEEYAIRLVDFYYQQALYAWYAKMPTSDSDQGGKPVRGDITDRNFVASLIRTQEEKDNYLARKYVDWMKEIEQPAPIQNYDISVSGKTNKTNYYLSGGYSDQKGRVMGDQFNRTSIHTSLENKITDWITIGINSTYAHRDYGGMSASYSNAMRASPLVDVKDAQGNYPVVLALETEYTHPLQLTVVSNEDIRRNLFMLGYVKIEIPKIKGLTYDFNYSNNLSTSRDASFYPSATTRTGNANRGQANKNHSESTSWIFNNIVTYNRLFGGNHSVNMTLLFSREGRTGESSSLTSSGFDNEILGYNGMEFGTLPSLNTGGWEESSISYMARLNYAFKNRYLVTATVRRDGFSGFGGNKKTATFPSLSLGWVLSEEEFLKNLNVIDFLKLRTSIGANGNQGIGRYSSFSKMGSANYIFGASTAIGIYPSSLGNSDLGWETTTSYNVGIDLGVLSNRITASVDAYIAETSDVLVQRQLPRSSGYTSVWTNIGGISNKGIELSLKTINVEKILRWESRFAFSLNRDKITKLYGGEEDRDLGNNWFVGEPISAIYDYESDGYKIWTEKEFYEGKIKIPRTYPGHIKIIDQNGDGDLDPNNDRKIIGYRTPNFRFSIANDLSYKNFTLSFFINSIIGGKRYYLGDNGELAFSCYQAGSGGDAAIQYIYRYNQVITNQYWSPDNGVTNAPALYFLPRQNIGYWISRGFVRLQDATLSYRFGKNITDALQIDGLQVYVSSKNLYTWTKWQGWDPETGDYASLMRNVIAGIRLSF